MRVLFYLARVDEGHPYYQLAAGAVASVRKHMPHATIVHHSDLTSPAISGVDEVVRSDRKDPLILHRFKMMSEEREFLSLDVDVVLQADLSHVFEQEFDVALTLRERPIKFDGEILGSRDRYNGGVMFSRNPQYWKDCVSESLYMPIDMQDWMGPQIAMTTIAPEYKVLELPDRIYNYAPKSEDDDLSECKAVHYKGMRKDMLLAA